MNFTHPLEFHIWALNIRAYSICMVLAMLTGIFVSYFIAKKYYKKIETEILWDIYPVLILGGIIGARLYYVLLNIEYFWLYKNEIIMIQNGGISIHGAILGGIIAGYIYCKIKKINFLYIADIVSYGLILAQAVGRLGNFFNLEAFGKPCNLPFKIFIPYDYRPLMYQNYEYFHPTFLYEIIWNIIVFGILFLFLRGRVQKGGVIFFFYLILYSLGRFFIEGIRTDSVLNLGQMPVAQVISIIIILTSGFCLFKIYEKK